MHIKAIKGLRHGILAIVSTLSGVPLAAVKILYERYGSMDVTLAVVEYMASKNTQNVDLAERAVSHAIRGATDNRYSIGHSGHIVEWGNRLADIPWDEILDGHRDTEAVGREPSNFLND